MRPPPTPPGAPPTGMSPVREPVRRSEPRCLSVRRLWRCVQLPAYNGRKPPTGIGASGRCWGPLIGRPSDPPLRGLPTGGLYRHVGRFRCRVGNSPCSATAGRGIGHSERLGGYLWVSSGFLSVFSWAAGNRTPPGTIRPVGGHEFPFCIRGGGWFEKNRELAGSDQVANSEKQFRASLIPQTMAFPIKGWGRYPQGKERRHGTTAHGWEQLASTGPTSLRRFLRHVVARRLDPERAQRIHACTRQDIRLCHNSRGGPGGRLKSADIDASRPAPHV